MKIYKGNILSINKNNDVFKYLIENNGIITYIGNILPKEYINEQIIDLKDKALIPTFSDTHQHFASFSLFNAGLNVMDCESNEKIIKKIEEYKNKCKSKFLIVFGASPYSVKERRLINKKELDSVCPNIPVFMVKYDGHACVINSALLKKVEKKISNLRGYHPDTGEMNQECFFAVSDYITNHVNIVELISDMKNAIDFEISKGIGLIHTVSGVGFPFNLDISIESYVSKQKNKGFQIRVFPQSMNTSVATIRRLPRIGGCFKCALDGCFGSQDAALNEPYIDNGDKGVLYYSDEQVIEFCKKANRKGLQIEMHAIGDKAFDQATKALKAALDDYPRNNHRHGIIHACLPTKEGIEICKKYDIQLPMQIAFDDWKQEPPEYLIEILGKERNDKLNPINTFNKEGCLISFSSDAPCTNPNPIEWLYKACNHSNSNESISIQEALRMATYNGYYVSFDEKQRGSLEKGKIADMVILSKNPYSIPKEQLNTIKIVSTILNGKEVYTSEKIGD